MFKRAYNKLKLLQSQILGINARNLDYVYKLNDRRLFDRVDDKLITKDILSEYNIPCPKTLAVFKTHFDLRKVSSIIQGVEGFVIKPACGSGGKGIMPLRAAGSFYTKTDGTKFTIRDIEEHIIDILSGRFSLEHQGDAAFIEELIETEKSLMAISYKGLPDIRIIVAKGRPVMGMLRVSTKASAGKANLHQGAIGVGIDLENGRMQNAVLNRNYITFHPDTGEPFSGKVIPHWRKIIKMSIDAAAAVGLGYLGVDLALDSCKGPLILEINARPGLEIQLACNTGLKPILRKEILL